MRKTGIVALLFGLVFTPLMLAQQERSIAAKVLSVQGQVEIEQSPWAVAQVNQILYAGDRIRTGPRSRAALLLADETQLKLAENSELELRVVRPASNLLIRVAEAGARADQSILNVNKGKAWIRSKKVPAAAQITTPAVTAAIRGTEFAIRVEEDGETFATVIEGSIDFFNDRGRIIVNPGEQGRCRVGEAPTKVVVVNPEDAVQWMLFYSAAVSPRDYPFIAVSPPQAPGNPSGGGANPVRVAQVRHDAGELNAALTVLDGISSPEAAEVRGWIYLEQNRIREAIAQLSLASPQSFRTRLGLSLAHYRANEREQAYAYVRDPGSDGRLRVQKAMLDLLSGDAERARALLESIPANDPAFSLGQGLLSNVYLTQNKKDQALEAARKAVEANPNSPSAYLSLSLAQQSFFDLPAAMRSAEKALELDPEFVQAQVQYAKLLFGAGDARQAERIVRRTLAGAPQEAAAHSVLGFILLGQGKTDEARVAFGKSVQLDNTAGEPRLGLGIANMREGRVADAVLEFLEATTLEPRVSLYHSYLGKAFYQERKFEQAFSALDVAMELDPRDPTPHLYAGIFEEELNRPGVAIRDFQNSIERNDNRAVYRSRFVLDEDRATRNIKLASAYNRLGLSEMANLEAIKSYASDPTNSSTRIFLADTFLNLDGRTVAGGSELLMARLLLPVNANSFNAFNDYTTLFELPRMNWTTQGRLGNLDTNAQSVITSGGTRRFAYGSIFTRDRSDGWRPQNDDSRTFTNVNLFKFAPAPRSDFMFTYSQTQTRQGDQASTFLVSPDNDPDRRIFNRVQRAEVGYHQQFNPGSELVVYFAGRTVDQVVDDPKCLRVLGIDVDCRRSSLTPNVSLQAAHLLKVSDFQFKYGFDIFEGRSRTREVLNFVFPGDPPELVSDEFGVERQKVRFKTTFLEGDYLISPKLILTGGIKYDWASDNNMLDEERISMNRWNPHAGVLVSPFETTTFRFGFTRTMQTHTQERLVPTHLLGFILNPNEFELTRATGYHAGWDQRLFGGRTFLRTTAFWRDRVTPSLQDGSPVEFEGDIYGGRLALNQFITDSFTGIADYAITRDVSIFGLRHDHDLGLRLFYIHPRGYFFQFEEEYLNQSGLFGRTPVETNVWMTNFSISYEMPEKMGLLSVRVSNLFNPEFFYLADPLELEPRVPRRRLSLDLNFFF